MTAREELEQRRHQLAEMDHEFRRTLFQRFGIVLPVRADPEQRETIVSTMVEAWGVLDELAEIQTQLQPHRAADLAALRERHKPPLPTGTTIRVFLP